MPLLTVHVNTLAPTERPLTALVFEAVLAMVPVPLLRVQAPVPTAGSWAFKFPFSEQMLKSTPALAGPGGAKRVTVT